MAQGWGAAWGDSWGDDDRLVCAAIVALSPDVSVCVFDNSADLSVSASASVVTGDIMGAV